MNIVDANVLINSVNQRAPQHETCKEWLQNEFSSARVVGLPSVCQLAFLRITTHPRLLAKPLHADQAIDILDGWLRIPGTLTPEPGPRALDTLREVAARGRAAGNLMNDAYLAALAIDHGGGVVTMARDFGRFNVPIIVPGT